MTTYWKDKLRRERQNARQTLIDAVTFWRHAECAHPSCDHVLDCPIAKALSAMRSAHDACAKLRALDGIATFESGH
jgi:hypothetical protein